MLTPPSSGLDADTTSQRLQQGRESYCPKPGSNPQLPVPEAIACTTKPNCQIERLISGGAFDKTVAQSSFPVRVKAKQAPLPSAKQQPKTSQHSNIHACSSAHVHTTFPPVEDNY